MSEGTSQNLLLVNNVFSALLSYCVFCLLAAKSVLLLLCAALLRLTAGGVTATDCPVWHYIMIGMHLK